MNFPPRGCSRPTLKIAGAGHVGRPRRPQAVRARSRLVAGLQRAPPSRATSAALNAGRATEGDRRRGRGAPWCLHSARFAGGLHLSAVATFKAGNRARLHCVGSVMAGRRTAVPRGAQKSPVGKGEAGVGGGRRVATRAARGRGTWERIEAGNASADRHFQTAPETSRTSTPLRAVGCCASKQALCYDVGQPLKSQSLLLNPSF